MTLGLVQHLSALGAGPNANRPNQIYSVCSVRRRRFIFCFLQTLGDMQRGISWRIPLTNQRVMLLLSSDATPSVASGKQVSSSGIMYRRWDFSSLTSEPRATIRSCWYERAPFHFKWSCSPKSFWLPHYVAHRAWSTSRRAAVAPAIHQDASANQNEPRHTQLVSGNFLAFIFFFLKD